MNLDDLFEMRYDSTPQDPKLSATDQRLASCVWYDDGPSAVTCDEDVLTCKQCGSLVLISNAEVHLSWHRRMEAIHTGSPDSDANA